MGVKRVRITITRRSEACNIGETIPVGRLNRIPELEDLHVFVRRACLENVLETTANVLGRLHQRTGGPTSYVVEATNESRYLKT